MKFSIRSVWEDVRTSFWFVPTIMTIGAVILSIITLLADRESGFLESPVSWWVYSGGADGARSVLAAISGSMITVTSVVFSITIVTLTLASGQFGSRVLRNFMRDTGNQVTLGTFIATFIYSLLILRSVRSEGENEFIPYLSVTVGVILVFFSVGVLIYFIHHVSSNIQAESIVNKIYDETIEAVESQFSDEEGKESGSKINSKPDLPESFYDKAHTIKATQSNYLQVIKYDEVLKRADGDNLIVELLNKPGDFITKGNPVLRIWPPQKVDQTIDKKLYDTLIFGVHRNLSQNAEYGLKQLVEIAVRALSPGINDPFTAINCIDRLAAILSQLTHRHFPSPFHYSKEGKLLLILKPSTFEGFVNTSFNQIRQNSQSTPAVMMKLMEAIETIMTQASKTDQYKILRKHADMIRNTGKENLKEQNDWEDLELRYKKIVKHLGNVELGLV
ncbi:MAG: DUF2254 domain-containing protein [Balneolaceae bacterium]